MSWFWCSSHNNWETADTKTLTAGDSNYLEQKDNTGQRTNSYGGLTQTKELINKAHLN